MRRNFLTSIETVPFQPKVTSSSSHGVFAESKKLLSWLLSYVLEDDDPVSNELLWLSNSGGGDCLQWSAKVETCL